jgi:DNA-binding CsgD family transcriptional regulator
MEGDRTTNHQEVIYLTPSGKAKWISSGATRLLIRYCDSQFSSAQLPQLVADWIKKCRFEWKKNDQRGCCPLVLTRDRKTLVVRFVEDNPTHRLLLLKEENEAPRYGLKEAVLTNREREVLFWITEGKSNRDIALILSLSPRTIEKHAERLFKKLGVETRTAAMLHGLEIQGKEVKSTPTKAKLV